MYSNITRLVFLCTLIGGGIGCIWLPRIMKFENSIDSHLTIKGRK